MYCYFVNCSCKQCLSLQDSLYVGAVGAYTRAGSVFDYGEPEFGLRGFINETDLEHLIQPVNISDFRESYLGRFVDKLMINLSC